jgi:hypothetical protein
MARTQTGSVPSKKKAQVAKRRVLVFSALAGSLTVTALLLQLLSPPPVRGAQTSPSLFAADSPESISRALAVPTSRPWKYIYIHHSKTFDGDADSVAGGDLGDHFVICNGVGGADGEVQPGYRWDHQLPAVAPRGSSAISSDCISICLVGDFDRTRPTPAQMNQLGKLVTSLQAKHGIPSRQVVMVNQSAAPSGIGTFFPVSEFRQRIGSNP